MALAASNRKPALIAAARKISYSRADTQKLKEESWQERAWQVYDRLPAVFYMTRYRSDIASKIEYYVGRVTDPSADPEVDADDQGNSGDGSKVLEGEGGSDLLRRVVSEFIVHWDVPGEGYLCRFDEAPFWRVLSTQELKKTGNSFIWGDGQMSEGPIDADNVYRVWDPHPRFHWQADSPTRHIIEDAEELILLGREAKARSMSRLSAGILWISDRVDISPFGSDTEGDEDDFARELTRRMALPLVDPGSAASLVPWVLSADPVDIGSARHMTFERDWDISLELRRELLRSVATGLDLPPEILTGVADLNHWSAWLVSEMAVSQHVLPTVDAILDSLTVNWFRPLLEASGVDPDGYVLWRDPSPATVPPDQSEVAIKLFELGGISGEAVRRVTNFDEDDAPSPEELDRLKPVQETPEVNGPPDAIQAAAVAAITADVPAQIDAELLSWLVELSHQEIERLVGIAEDTAMTAAADPLDGSLLARFAERVDRRIAQAQSKVRQWLARLTGEPVNIDGQDAARAAGVALIVKAVIDHVRGRLFTPDPSPDPIDLGEIPEVPVPVGALRDGLSVAGGGLPFAEDERAWQLIGNGKDANDVLLSRGFRTLSYRWDYREWLPRGRQFKPHKDLNGKPFASWDDPELGIKPQKSKKDKDKMLAAWPPQTHYRPGDHEGCQCMYTRILTLSLQIPVAAAV